MFEPVREDFEGDRPGSYPDRWTRDGADSQEVTADAAHGGNQSLALAGSHGGCWEAIANAQFGSLPADQTVRIAGALKPGAEGSFGCHDKRYSRVRLRTEVGSWSAGDNVGLLSFDEDGVVRGHGLEFVQFSPGDWVEFEVLLELDSERETASMQFDVASRGERLRGETTVESPQLREVSHLAVNSGDFTTYVDDVVVDLAGNSPATTRTTTQPDTTAATTTRRTTTRTTTTRPTTATQTTTTTTGSEYDLRAGTKTTVRPDGRPLYVIRNIPELPDSRRAVTTTSYALVDEPLAMDALTAADYQSGTPVVDYAERLQTAREHREHAQDLQLFGRAVDAGWDVTIIANSFLVGQPQLGVGNAISLLTDTISWGYMEYTEPYEEGFTKMTATLTNANSIRAKSRRMRTSDDIASDVGAMLDAMHLGAEAASTGSGLVSAWDTALTALQRSRFPTHAADDTLRTADDLAAQSVDDAVAASSGLFAGFAIGLATSEISSVVKAKTKIHTTELAFETVRIPLLRRLGRLQDLAQSGHLTYPQAVEYGVAQATEMQMGAILFQVGADYWDAISESSTGLVWDIVSNASEKASNYRATAQALENTAKWLYIGAGADASTLADRYESSVNAEVLDGGERA